MANSNGWGDGAANNSIGWGQGANNAIAWGDSHAKSWAGATDIVGITTDPDAQAFITAAAITEPTQRTAIDTLVKGMKADGLWTKMKAIYPFVGGTASAHKWNLKDPRDLDAAFRLVFNGGWTHSANGATPNGVNAYANTYLNPNTDSSIGNNYMSISAYTNSNLSGSNTNIIGAYDSRETAIAPRWSSGQFFSEINDDVFTNIGVTNSNSQGFYIANKNNTGNNTGFKNGVKVINGANLSSGKTNLNLYVGARNNGGISDRFSNYNTEFIHIGLGLNDTEAANLYTRVQAFQTALSRQV